MLFKSKLGRYRYLAEDFKNLINYNGTVKKVKTLIPTGTYPIAVLNQSYSTITLSINSYPMSLSL